MGGSEPDIIANSQNVYLINSPLYVSHQIHRFVQDSNKAFDIVEILFYNLSQSIVFMINFFFV